MRYFTPELYLKLQSADEQSVDAAMEEWEKAIQAYERHLETIKTQLPPVSRAIAQMDFHDWSLLMFSPNAADGTSAAELIILLQQAKEIAVLSYSLTRVVERFNPPPAWDLSGDQVYWLYDELDVSADGTKSFTHRILLSDGTIVLVNFSSCRVRKTSSDRAISHADLASLIKTA